MRRYSTPTVEVIVEGQDLTGMDVVVTFRQGPRRLDVEDPAMTTDTHDQVTDTVLAVPLTQVQSGSFAEGTVEVQVNYMDAQGHRVATTIGALEAERNLLDEVVEGE